MGWVACSIDRPSMDRMDQYYVCYACKRDSSCSCIFGVRLGLIESTAEPQASSSTYFLHTRGLPCSPWGLSASATISSRRSLAPASNSIRHVRQTPFNATLSIAALDVACSCSIQYVMRVKTWGSGSERLEKWGAGVDTERILLVMLGAGGEGTSGREAYKAWYGLGMHQFGLYICPNVFL